MSRIVCPNCGLVQDNAGECRRCGIIFERYRGQEYRSTIPHAPTAGRPGLSLYAKIRWALLGLCLLILILVLWGSHPPEVVVDPMATHSAEIKVMEHQRLSEAKRAHTLELNQPELNGWLSGHLALARSDMAPSVAAAASPEEVDAIERARSNVRDVKVELLEDSLRAHVVFDLYGMDLTLMLEGKILARDGYMRFEPSGGKLGLLPLPQSSLQSAVRRLFDSPENREKFRLPADVKEIGIRQGKLYIVSG